VFALYLIVGWGLAWIYEDFRPVPPLPDPVIGNNVPSETLVLPGETLRPLPQASTSIKPFTPTSVVIQGIGNRPVQVLARIKVGNNGFSLPDPEGLAPQVFAWDRDGAKPGSLKGAVNFTAHTYPPGQEALGNLLYQGLQVGDTLTVKGASASLQYRVVERDEVRLARYPGNRVLDTSGPSVLTITVCSGERRGPGDWTMRTVWFAVPVK